MTKNEKISWIIELQECWDVVKAPGVSTRRLNVDAMLVGLLLVARAVDRAGKVGT